MLAIAATYESFELAQYREMRLTNVVCDFAPDRYITGITPADGFAPDKGPHLEVSRSRDDGTHGKKLYLVFAKSPDG